MLDQLQHLEDDPLYGQVEQALAAGDLETARALVHRLMAGERFRLGMAALESGDSPNAAAEFERVLALDPYHHLARAELARTYFTMNELARSRHEFERVLAAGPPDEVRTDIERYLARLAEPSPARRSWSVRVVAGALYDDNVNYGPAAEFIRVRPIALGASTITRLSVSDESRPQEAHGVYTSVSAFGHHEAGTPGSWSWFGEANYYETWLEDAQDFEVRYGSLSAGPRHITRTRLLDLPLRYEHIRRGGETLVDIVGTSPALVHAPDDTHHWVTSAAAEYRDYDEANSLDSVYGKLGQSYRRFFNHGAHNASAGLFGLRQHADDKVFSNTGVEVVLTATLRLPWQSTAALRGQYRGEWYDEAEVLAPASRQDNQFLFEAQVKKHITEQWAVALTYQYTRNTSTFDLYDYDRNFATVGIVGNL